MLERHVRDIMNLRSEISWAVISGVATEAYYFAYNSMTILRLGGSISGTSELIAEELHNPLRDKDL